MKVLVTGGCGFIGSNFIRAFLGWHGDARVVNLDKLTYAGNPGNLRDIEDNPRYRFIRGDVCDAGVVAEAMDGCGAVLNFAAESHVDRSIADSGAFVRTGVNGVHTLLEAARRVRLERFIQVSTDEVYGSIAKGAVTEDAPLNPSSPYSAAKAAGDLLAMAYGKTYGLPVIVTRSSNNYGPFQYPEKLIPLFITNALGGKPLPLYGDGSNVREWIHVLDNCRAIDLVLREGVPGTVYNISGGGEMTNRGIAERIVRELGVPGSAIMPVADRPGHDFRYALDCGRIRALGYRPEIDLEHGLRETIAWYRDNQHWWKKLDARIPGASFSGRGQ